MREVLRTILVYRFEKIDLLQLNSNILSFKTESADFTTTYTFAKIFFVNTSFFAHFKSMHDILNEGEQGENVKKESNPIYIQHSIVRFELITTC